ncbi:MAG TPA: adenine phosphoribosyltransferase [Acidimicrobiales bacterium]|nr:adenine phosphoribosyltransferase [Acidimicrobiales bacterium]
MPVDVIKVRELVRDVADFPRPGIGFKDLTPVLADGHAYAFLVDWLADQLAGLDATKVVGVEARGFLLAGPVARALGAGVVPMRKAGKLPWEVESASYSLEYGEDRLEIHRDAVSPGETVVVVDDVLATGGTAAAAASLLERLGAEVAALAFVLELEALGGRQRLAGRPVHAMVTYP